MVPKHTVITEEEKKVLFEKFNIAEVQLPKILAADPAIKAIDAKIGDIVKIERDSPTAGTTVYYRFVVKS
jgi:DNA-directed RNA polymerase subunit H